MFTLVILFVAFASALSFSLVGKFHFLRHQHSIHRKYFSAVETTERAEYSQKEDSCCDPTPCAVLLETPVGQCNASTPDIDSHLQDAIKNKESVLSKELKDLEQKLWSERQMLAKIQDKISESGKNAYFMVQSQVHDFAVSVFSTLRITWSNSNFSC